jgi:hypothetical protein
MRLRPLVVSTLGLLVAAALRAQTIRGNVVDETSKLPLFGVAITLLDDGGAETQAGTRSDSFGNFIVHASRAGTWRVKAMRIGYAPITSDPVTFALGGLAVVRLRMTTVAQQLVPVQIIEQRLLNASELMSSAGFDLRRSRGLGRFMDSERLEERGQDGLREILGTDFQPTLYVMNDPVIGDVIRMRQGSSICAPEIYLDGRLLATAPEPGAIVDGAAPITALDSMRAQARGESEQMRLAGGQIAAISLLSSLRADGIHGIEVYRANEVPPPSLGAWFGITKASIRPCGTLAVWTKRGAQSLSGSRLRPPGDGGRAIQVISGTLLDFDTGNPVAGRSVTLLAENKEATGVTVVTDERGDFTLRTTRAGELRLSTGGTPYKTSTTPAFRIGVDELVFVKLFVSARAPVTAPLGVAARLLPQQVGLTTLAGFTYRRERALGGEFFRMSDIERVGARSLPDLLRGVDGVVIDDRGSVSMRRESGTCAPNYFVDGVRTVNPSVSVTSLFGVEVYAKESEIPPVFADAKGCGAIVIWTRK